MCKRSIYCILCTPAFVPNGAMNFHSSKMIKKRSATKYFYFFLLAIDPPGNALAAEKVSLKKLNLSLSNYIL